METNETEPEKNKGGRPRRSIKEDWDINRMILKCIRNALTVPEIKQKLAEEKIDISDVMIYKRIRNLTGSIMSDGEKERLFLHLFHVRTEMLGFARYNVMMQKEQGKDLSPALRAWEDIQTGYEQFIARYGIVPAVPIRQEVDLDAKIDFEKLLDYVNETWAKRSQEDQEKKE